MRKIIFSISISSILLSFCVSKPQTQAPKVTASYIQDIYIDKENDSKDISNYIGIFPINNDTITIYKLDENLLNEESKTLFWHSKSEKNKNTTFFNSENDSVNVRFENNTIFINQDSYELNSEYYQFLKQKVVEEKSILDLAFLVREGYGDYSVFFNLLNKNWKNQTANKNHKIISAKIINRDFQTDDEVFSTNFTYEYTSKGLIKNISGINKYSKKFVTENNKYIHYSIAITQNERASLEQDLYFNKKTHCDSVVGIYEQYSTATSTHYIMYQSKLKQVALKNNSKSLAEIIKIFDLK